MKKLQTFETFNFDPKGKVEKIQYALIYNNLYNGDETTILTSSNLEKVLEEFLRKFIKFIKNEWGTPKNYFKEVLDELVNEIEPLTSWDSFFNLVYSYPEINDNDYLPSGLGYEDTYYIDIREKGKGYQIMGEIRCLKKIYDLDKNVLDTYLKFD